MERIMESINLCISICYVMNIDFLRSKGRRADSYILASLNDSTGFDEWNRYLCLFLDESLSFSVTEEDLYLESDERIRVLDEEIIERIMKLSGDEKCELYNILASKREKMKEEVENVHTIRMVKIEALRKMDRRVNDSLFFDLKLSILKLSRKNAILSYFVQRYEQYMAYINGLCANKINNKRMIFRKKK